MFDWSIFREGRAWLIMIGWMILIVLLLSFARVVFGDPVPTNENEWTDFIAVTELRGALTQETLYDGTRPDIIWQQQAIEVDWSYKWAEGVGQAIYYGRMTSKTPTVLLLTKSGGDYKKDQKYVTRAVVCMAGLGDVWWYDCNLKGWRKR